MLRRPALWLLICVTPALAKPTIVVHRIDIRGLRSTRTWVVQRELYFAIGDTVTDNELEDAHKRLHNLHVFNDAAIRADSAGTVVVSVTEAWPILPLLGVSLTHGNFSDAVRDPRGFWDDLNLLAGIRHWNFRGNAEQLFLYAQTGNSRGYFVGYTTRWLGPHGPVSVDARFQHLIGSDRHASVLDSTRDLEDNHASLEIGRRRGARARPSLGVEYQYVKQESEWPAEGRTFKELWLSPYIGLDYRDLEWWPSRGGMAESRVNIVYGTEDFLRSQYALRGYVPLGSFLPDGVPHRPVVLALQLSAATSTTNTPSFAHYYYGFEEGLRGYWRNQSESSGYLRADAELRFPITTESTYNVPFIGRWGKRWPFGVAGVLFVERGELQVANRRSELLGYGAGIYLRIPYVELVELALALNRDGGSELSLKLGVTY